MFSLCDLQVEKSKCYLSIVLPNKRAWISALPFLVMDSFIGLLSFLPAAFFLLWLPPGSSKGGVAISGSRGPMPRRRELAPSLF